MHADSALVLRLNVKFYRQWLRDDLFRGSTTGTRRYPAEIFQLGLPWKDEVVGYQ